MPAVTVAVVVVVCLLCLGSARSVNNTDTSEWEGEQSGVKGATSSISPIAPGLAGVCSFQTVYLPSDNNQHIATCQPTHALKFPLLNIPPFRLHSPCSRSSPTPAATVAIVNKYLYTYELLRIRYKYLMHSGLKILLLLLSCLFYSNSGVGVDIHCTRNYL